jgi:hypothetical protein
MKLADFLQGSRLADFLSILGGFSSESWATFYLLNIVKEVRDHGNIHFIKCSFVCYVMF